MSVASRLVFVWLLCSLAASTISQSIEGGEPCKIGSVQFLAKWMNKSECNFPVPFDTYWEPSMLLHSHVDRVGLRCCYHTTVVLFFFSFVLLMLAVFLIACCLQIYNRVDRCGQYVRIP